MVDRTEQVKGVALVPKRAMDLMSGEVDRVLVLATNSIISVPYIVPRKVCASVCAYNYVYVNVWVLSVPACMYVCVCMPVFMCVCVCVCLCVFERKRGCVCVFLY